MAGIKNAVGPLAVARRLGRRGQQRLQRRVVHQPPRLAQLPAQRLPQPRPVYATPPSQRAYVLIVAISADHDEHLTVGQKDNGCITMSAETEAMLILKGQSRRNESKRSVRWFVPGRRLPGRS